MTVSLQGIPELETEHLHLRGPQKGDFEPYATIFADAERSKGIGGPLDRPTAWRGFSCEIGHWMLHGYGLWTVVEKSTNRIAGRVGFWNPEGWPEVELGWTVYDGFEGKGYAYEAALCARSYAYDTLGWGPLISLIADNNVRSIRLAERLGARNERRWTSPSGKWALIYRHPAKEDLI